MNVCVVMPTLGRAQQARTAAMQFLRTSLADVVVVASGLSLVFESAGAFYVEASDQMTAVQKWNLGLSRYPDYDAYVLGADDLWPESGWLDAALKKVLDGYGLVGFNDGHTEGTALATHYLMTRAFLMRHHGGVLAI